MTDNAKRIPDFSNLTIVLHSVESPGNVGSTARAMRNMGLENLLLINPPDLQHDEAKKLAYASYDIIEKAEKVSSFQEALAKVDIAIATTRRKGKWRERFLPPEEIGRLIMENKEKQKIAVIFGPEKTGLTNEEVLQCEYSTEIPTVVDYPSLNVSQAVVIYVYEIYRAYMRSCELAPFSNGVVRAPKAEYQRLFERAIRVMNSLGMTEGFSDKFSKSFNRLLGRADWSIKDIATFDALLKHTENYIERQTSRE